MRNGSLLIFCLFFFLKLSGQLSNRTLRYGEVYPQTKYGFNLEALQYTRNTEYFHNLNPGSTMFGFQLSPGFHYRITNKVRMSTGIMLQRDFGDYKSLSRAIPFFNFGFTYKNWVWNLGNIKPHVHHNVIEPLLNYENFITQPIEGGLQGVRQTDKMKYDFWLEWRQKANGEEGIQEKIVFGHSLEELLLNTSRLSLSIPLQTIIYHQGGQALNVSSHVATRLNGAAGIRLQNQNNSLLCEAFALYSADNSDTRMQPFQNGWASMVNARYLPGKYHEIAVTWWHARQFVTSTGNPVFSSVNLNDVYLNRNTRRLAMFRYVYSRPIVADKLWVDFRLEPYYDFEAANFEFAQGLFFRYVENLNIKIPRWMGL